MINNPFETAQKHGIRVAAATARWTTAFAKFYVDVTCHIIRQLLVRVRNDNGLLVRGVTLCISGVKYRLDSVDNVRIWFDHVRIRHDPLIRRHAQFRVPDGFYTSHFSSPDVCFGVCLAALPGGLVSVETCSLNKAKTVPEV